MRANTPTRPSNAFTADTDTAKSCRANDYVVPPIYVHDRVSAAAAYFLTWFTGMESGLLRDVVKRGLREGGFIDEVEHWKYQCEADVETVDNGLDYWPIEENGPWVYGDVGAADIAKVVCRHIRGWTIGDFAFYGYTLKEQADLEVHIAEIGANYNLTKRK